MKKSKFKIVIIGTGLLGESISERLLKENFNLSVWNRTKTKYKKLLKKGAKEIKVLSNLDKKINTIILVLKDGEITSSVINKIGCLKNKSVIQMGTIGSKESKRINQLVKDKNGSYLEAPVLGSVSESLNGNLLFMIGGNKKNFNKNKKIFDALSKNYVLFENVEKASATKLALNYQIAYLTFNFSLTIRYLLAKGINLDLFMKLFRKSALYAPHFDKKLKRIRNKDYKNGNFNIENLSKDINLFTDEIQNIKMKKKLIEEINSNLKKYKDSKLENLDYSCLHELSS